MRVQEKIDLLKEGKLTLPEVAELFAHLANIGGASLTDQYWVGFNFLSDNNIITMDEQSTWVVNMPVLNDYMGVSNE